MDTIEARFAAESGVRYANNGDFRTAIQCFTDAIRLFAFDYRYFLNRSFCHFYLAEYEDSLQDADQAVTLSEGHATAKPQYRRAMSLMALGRLTEALAAFELVLQLDNTCPVSEEKRRELRSFLLQEAGVTETTARIMAAGTVPLSELLEVNSQKKQETQEPVEQVSQSDPPADDSLNQSCGDSEQNKCMDASSEVGVDGLPLEHQKSQSPDPDTRLSVLEQVMQSMPELLDTDAVTNPLEFHAVTASNVSSTAKKSELEKLFGQFGEVFGIFRLKSSATCSQTGDAVTVMVHFMDSVGPVNAVTGLRNAIFEEGITANPLRPMTVKLTASQSQKECKFLTLAAAENKVAATRECFQWRGPIGCSDDDCTLLHIRSCLRVDSHAYFSWLKQQEEATPAKQ